MNIGRALAIRGLTGDDDVEWLAEQASSRRTIIEIGPYLGRSTRALADNCQGPVYAIDNWNAAVNAWRPDQVAKAACYANLADLIEEHKVILIEHNSQDGIPYLLQGLQADMLWIDGDHAYAAVINDIRNYAPLVCPGGLVCGHDYSCWHPEVMKAVDQVYGAQVCSLDIHRSIWWVTV